MLGEILFMLVEVEFSIITAEEARRLALDAEAE